MMESVILLVDDEPQIHRFLHPALAAAGYRVIGAARGDEARTLLARDRPDLVLLDLGLPDVDGQDLLLDLRALSSAPIIVLSARDQEREKIAALDSGADDYVEKPFGVGELLARIRTALRRRQTNIDAPHTPYHDDINLDHNRLAVTVGAETVLLTRLQFRLLALLLAHRGKVLTHEQILARVWGPGHREDVAYLRIYIAQLRRRLGTFGEEHILTRPGVGYYLS